MAGDWFREWAGGIDPLFQEEQKITSHMRNQHRVLFGNMKERYPDLLKMPSSFPDSEATIDGKMVETKVLGLIKIHSYCYQVLSYHAMEMIYKGFENEGMSVIEMFYERIYRCGWPWSSDLFGNGAFIYMTNTVLWALPNALTGAKLNIPSRKLSFSKRFFQGEEEKRFPVFFPSFWGMLTWQPQFQSGSFKVIKTFGKIVTLDGLFLEQHHDSLKTQTEKVLINGPISLLQDAQFFFYPIDVKSKL